MYIKFDFRVTNNTKLSLWGSKNLGPCIGLKSHILSMIRPDRKSVV